MNEVIKTYSPGSIANYILKSTWFKHSFDSLTLACLQKVLYVAQGVYLAKYSTDDKLIPLINEPFITGEFDPIIQSVYHEFKRHGSAYLTKANIYGQLMAEVEYNKTTSSYEIVENTIPESDILTIEHLDFILTIFKRGHSLFRKSQITWIEAKELGLSEGITRYKEISNHAIRDYFKGLDICKGI